jgi:hypothetical protein
MHAVSLLVSLVAALSFTQAPQEKPTPAPTLTGKWTMTLEMQSGTASPSIEFVQAGEKITGQYAGRYGRFPITGVLKGRNLQFSFSMNAEGTDVVMAFKGEVAADFQSIKGAADMGPAGEANWYAQRQKQ